MLGNQIILKARESKIELAEQVDHPVLITECVCNPVQSRSKMAELLLKLMEFHHYKYNQQLGICDKDGLVVCPGFTTTHVIPDGVKLGLAFNLIPSFRVAALTFTLVRVEISNWTFLTKMDGTRGRLVPTHKTWRDNQERAEVGDVGHDSQRPSQLLCKVDRLLKNQGCLDLRAHWTVILVNDDDDGGYDSDVCCFQFVDGEPVYKACCRTNIGGFHVSDYLKQLLSLKYPHHMSRITWEKVEDLKMEHCYIATDYASEARLFQKGGKEAEDKTRCWQLPWVPPPVEGLPSEEEIARKAAIKERQGQRLREMAEAKRSSRINELENELQGLEFLLQQLGNVEEKDIASFLAETGYVSKQEIESSRAKVMQSLRKAKGEPKGEQAETEEKVDPSAAEKYPLINISDNMLTPEQLKEKKKQLFLKTTSEGRQRAKQKRFEEELERERQNQQDEEKRLENPELYLEQLRAKHRELSEKVEQRKRHKTNGNHTNGNHNLSGGVGRGERLNAAQKERMRLLTTAAFDRGKGEDTFGARDEDWQLYKLMSKDNDEDEEGPDAYEAELARISSRLQDIDPNFVSKSELVPFQPVVEVPSFRPLSKEDFQIVFGVERFRCPEILFHPNLVGVDQVGVDEMAGVSIRRLPSRSQGLNERMTNSILLTGGSCLFPGIRERLEAGIRMIRPCGSPIRVVRASDQFLMRGVVQLFMLHPCNFQGKHSQDLPECLILTKFDRLGAFCRENPSSNPNTKLLPKTLENPSSFAEEEERSFQYLFIYITPDNSRTRAQANPEMDSSERRKSGLNLPAGMSETSLRLETFSGSYRAISNLSSPSKATSCSDRFIPCRSSSRLHTFGLIEKASPVKEGGNEAYFRLLKQELFGSDFGSSPAGQGSPMSPSKNMLRFKTDHSGPNSPFSPSIFGPDSGFSSEASTPPKPPRKVPKTPHKVLDAPSLQDDFYLNLVDWSSQNVLAVGLGTCVYLWTASTSKVTKLCDLGPSDSVCSVQWTREGSYISIGTHLGQVQVWDGTQCKKVRTMSGHQTRTGVLAWSSRILSSGSRDRNILQHDLRVSNDFVSKLVGHKSEVCGLKWSHDDRELASGGNDNQLLVWNQHSQQPVLKLTEHTAAVKAIAWSPHQSGLLASGGGTADRCIRFWSTTNGNQLNHVDTGSQVCNLAWSKNVNELVSTHGYSQNQIMVWKYPSMTKVATLTGHSLRVLYLAMSPDGQTIVTGAGDETLRFWNIFPSMKTPAPVKDTGVWSMGRTHIR
ncbi:Protein FIZZY-related 3 [Vitis vinifera]|uniref:Actin-related protein 5 n=1 Tax=Vitis vinifera TaxID=29760 RepID=A0A438JXM6_VITVI|nr:Protein FIZZY-related 3 [Vitis vinifera]